MNPFRALLTFLLIATEPPAPVPSKVARFAGPVGRDGFGWWVA